MPRAKQRSCRTSGYVYDAAALSDAIERRRFQDRPTAARRAFRFPCRSRGRSAAPDSPPDRIITATTSRTSARFIITPSTHAGPQALAVVARRSPAGRSRRHFRKIGGTKATCWRMVLFSKALAERVSPTLGSAGRTKIPPPDATRRLARRSLLQRRQRLLLAELDLR